MSVSIDYLSNQKAVASVDAWIANPQNSVIVAAFRHLPDGEAFLRLAAQNNGYAAKNVYYASGGNPALFKQTWQNLGYNEIKGGGLVDSAGSFIRSSAPILEAAAIIAGVGAAANFAAGTSMFSNSADLVPAMSPDYVASSVVTENPATYSGVLTPEQLAGPVMSADYSAPAIAFNSAPAATESSSIFSQVKSAASNVFDKITSNVSGITPNVSDLANMGLSAFTGNAPVKSPIRMTANNGAQTTPEISASFNPVYLIAGSLFFLTALIFLKR